MFKKTTSTILILCYLLTSLSVNANPYYEAVHCFDERLDNPQEGDIARCLTGSNGQYMCPINSAACTTETELNTEPPTCPDGGVLDGHSCRISRKQCHYDRANIVYWSENDRGSKHMFGPGGFYSGNWFGHSFMDTQALGPFVPPPPSWSRGRLRETTTAWPSGFVYRRYEICIPHVTSSAPICPPDHNYNSGSRLCEQPTSRDVCPLGEQYQCVKSGTASYCSPNTCFNPDAEKEITDDQIDGSMLENNGATDDSGMCLDQVYIFSGRAQKCRPNGVQTAFKDCCATDGKVLKDSSGSSAQTEVYTQSINAVYQASAAAYQAYAAGATAAEASSAFSSAFVGAFDPTSLAIAVAIAIVMDYLAKACDQIETETALANSSGRCVDLGEFCKEKWLGKCVQKQRSFCCFNSQLAKIINEQGRLQLKAFQNLPNRGFGDRGNPQCRGFTPEEFQALDFSNIDLTEYYEELIHKSQAEMESTMEQMTAEHFNNVQ